MRLTVSHSTCYRYDPAVRYVTQSLKLTASRFAGQRVLNWQISAEGCTISAPFVDGYGDTVYTLTASGPLESLEVLVTGTVRTQDQAGVLKDHKEKAAPQVFLRATAATKADEAIAELALKVKAANSEVSPLELAHALANAVSDAIAYAPGSTHAHTSAAEALAAGQGVCQDHSQVLISAARSLCIPARYVSGYLFADADGVPHEAAHAWAELYIQGLGWVGFDCANRCCPTEYYIRLGSGLDARDAAPIRGVHSGGGEEQLDVSVVVKQSQQ
ncbi:transglutaminase family protein [Gallaecimonas mangrovi]|uniref:transglutaminase family protein n=1 Tax=Gallaecimonas mangrovi TaxID=2291597 RepID=UPI000E202062|nr:transglutaminase family protein [Gallaecimonas mangrovi]